MKRLSNLLFTAMLAGSLYSCGLPDFEADKLQIDEIPTAAPLGYITFDNITEYILVKSFQTTIPTVTVAARTGPPSPVAVVVDIPAYQTDVELTLNDAPDVVLDEAVVSSGTLSLELRYNLPSQTQLDLELPYIRDAAGQPFKRSIQLAKNQNFSTTPHVVSLDLQGYSVRPINKKIRVITSGKVTIAPGDVARTINIDPTVKLAALEFSSIKGYFGKKEFDLGAETVSVEDQLSGTVGIGTSGSVLKIAVENTVGVPFELDLSEVKALTKNNTSVSLAYTGNKIIKAGAISGNTISPTTTYFELNSSNSNISQFLSADTKEILFDIDVNANPGTGAPVPNFVTKDSRIKVSIGLLVPLKITPGA
ncbi:hypothetical protein [Rufibacter sp. LB8]|uniref:hypothetical protein n=1 Tax=Rufibacter sp. LB8 TaxID=2777781 RepID=UPI00178C5B39|nr:hypothetical protein [Rufibacter sp. LB8]